MEINDILSVALRSGASDIHLKAGLPPMFRVNGQLLPLKEAQRLSPEDLQRLVGPLLNNFQKERFRAANELDLAYSVAGLGRFRVNVFQQRGTLGAVFRVIPLKIATLAELGLPKVLEQIAMETRGLVLVTGTTGSGKSTTLASMIDYINSVSTSHILTIEDPIEFLLRDKRSVVNQREVGVDTLGYAPALKSALRQDPDVILVGEMRDIETIEIALTAAETGHLVMSTVHTLDATETVSRIVSAYPPHQQKMARLQLGSVLKAVISQRLVPRADGKGRAAALEVLRVTPRVRELIEDADRTKDINEAIATGHTAYGMQSFDQSLMQLYRNGVISYEEAFRQASKPDDFALRVSGVAGTSDSTWDHFDKSAEAAPSVSTKPQPSAMPSSPTPAHSKAVARITPASRPAPPPVPAAKPQTTNPLRPGEPEIALDNELSIERF